MLNDDFFESRKQKMLDQMKKQGFNIRQLNQMINKYKVPVEDPDVITNISNILQKKQYQNRLIIEENDEGKMP